MMSVPTFLFIRNAGRNVKLDLHRILYFEARKNYSLVVTTEERYMLLTTLKDWLALLPPETFCRIHRSYIVAIPKIESFDKKFVYLPGAELPIGEIYKNALTRKVIIVGGESVREPVEENPRSHSLANLHYCS